MRIEPDFRVRTKINHLPTVVVLPTVTTLVVVYKINQQARLVRASILPTEVSTQCTGPHLVSRCGVSTYVRALLRVALFKLDTDKLRLM